MPGRLHQEGWGVVVCAASGPSFTPEQAEQVEAARACGRVKVIAVCASSVTRLPNADAVYAADACFWKHYLPEIRAKCSGQLWTQDAPTALEASLHHVKLERGFGLSRKLDAINGGGNSGYQAVGLAYLFGARRIILVGYDMQRTGGLSHCHGDHPGRLHNPPQAAFVDWAKRFWPLAEDLRRCGVEVTNCTTETALTCFPRADLAETLNDLP